jgi:hypothetical protein
MFDKDHEMTHDEVMAQIDPANIEGLLARLLDYYLAQEEIGAQTVWTRRIDHDLRAIADCIEALGGENVYHDRLQSGLYRAGGIVD